MNFDKLEEKMREAPLISFEFLQKVPEVSGVYAAWLEGESSCFYVGSADNLKRRIDEHFSGSRAADRFCLYVYDLYVHDKRPSGLKTREVNRLTKVWIRENIKFKCVEVQKSEAKELEKEMRRKWKLILNPL